MLGKPPGYLWLRVIDKSFNSSFYDSVVAFVPKFVLDKPRMISVEGDVIFIGCGNQACIGSRFLCNQ